MSNNCETVRKHFSTSPDGNVLHGCRGNLPLSAFTCSDLITRDRRFIHTDKGMRGPDSVDVHWRPAVPRSALPDGPRDASLCMYASRKAAQVLHGGGTFSNSGNRWFDKTLQFVVGEDGSWGLLYEPATAEGPPIATLLHHILEYCEKPDPKRAPLVPLPMPKKLYFHIDREIKRDIEHAKQNLDILINDLDVNVFNFKRFGKDLPKQHSLSPNSFIQVALQLAYFRVHNEVCPACDIASQRMFRGGRTEYIRSPTKQTHDFILAFVDRTVSREAKLQLFREAVDAYTALTDRVLKGHGIDHHLLGLKLQAIEEGLSIPKIFMDTAYGLATHWKLRTGQVPANTDSVMCFGPLVPDGYAICYNPQADHVHFSITAFNCCEETHAETLALTLKDTLCQLQELLQPTV
ncbi:carnitine O-acetyltransferase-like [Plectropomus leopardus]|uniref:carnitine O-acetyltransferase-like n=1 Tax=Plectropomus leopardus TaxID=160734 RepID=UPI001C4D5895|nr:carnitine O-acetyltransferase-like [Plectropomus leopardus]